jgi:[ribosomal protein S18]-alanine N-acetyltransferase
MPDAAARHRTLRFEPLREEYIPAVLEIEQEANAAPWSERSFLNELTHKNSIFIVALLQGVVVGYGGVWLVVDEAHVTTVAVRQDRRREGIGRQIMIELLRRSKAAGMTCSMLEVRASNEAAVSLYERLGFAVTARRKGYYPDNREDAIVMWMHNLADWEPPGR